jgi:hypothetical protein
VEPRTVAHFEVVGRLGAGGMGVVYRARDRVLGRDVALKLVLPEHAGDTAARHRFLREARAAAVLTHPGIAAVYEAGEAASDESGGPAPLNIAEELVEGETLAGRLRRGPLEIEEVLRVGMQMAEALGEAHARGIVHRDDKPLEPHGHSRRPAQGARLRPRSAARVGRRALGFGCRDPVADGPGARRRNPGVHGPGADRRRGGGRSRRRLRRRGRALRAPRRPAAVHGGEHGVVAALAVAAVAWLLLERTTGPALAFKEREYVLVADVVNGTGESVFDLALKSALETGLRQSAYVNVLDPEQVQNTLRLMRLGPDSRLDEAVGLAVCRRAGARALVVPRIPLNVAARPPARRLVGPSIESATSLD